MRIELKKRAGGRIEFGIIYGLIALLILAATRFFPLLALTPSCVFKTLTGFPCPTCGATRSIVHLAHADLFSAFRMNPLTCIVFVGAAPVFLYCVATLVFALPRMNLTLTPKEEYFFRISAFAVVFLNWLYLLFAL